MNKSIVLLSGGLDSSTTLYFAKSKGYSCHCLIFDYGQRHKKEIAAAKLIARASECPLEVVQIALPWKGSALLDKAIQLPKNQKLGRTGIPPTYVPARNIIFLSFAASYAEAIGARHIFIGANAVDYSGYPDCRPDFMRAYQAMLAKGLKAGVQGKGIQVETPLIHLSKAQIVRLARKLGVPTEKTWSCYQGGAKPCGVCDSCRLREKGFNSVNSVRPTLTRTNLQKRSSGQPK